MRRSIPLLTAILAAYPIHAGYAAGTRIFDPPAVLFLIDNSASMRQTDPGLARFKALASMLDSIHAVAPSARVGAVVFSDRLAFDHRDNPLFRPLFPGDPKQHDSFIPLIPLDSLFGDWEKTGLDTLKELLAISGEGAPGARAYRGVGGGADFTLGFDAAREALSAVPQAKEARFIVFITDGAANVTDEIRLARENAYEAGNETPATFTICFDPESRRPSQTLLRMTANIRKNGYSAANPMSVALGVKRPAEELGPLLEKRVFAKILADQRRAAAASGASSGRTGMEPALRPAFLDGRLDGQSLTSVSDAPGATSGEDPGFAN